jgi:Cu/Ag efflux pump CusA
VIAVSFLPVLTLEAQEGRLFKPLAYTKNFAMIVAAVLAITLDPALRLLFFRKKASRCGRAGWAGSSTACWWARSTRKKSTPSAAC